MQLRMPEAEFIDISDCWCQKEGINRVTPGDIRLEGLWTPSGKGRRT